MSFEPLLPPAALWATVLAFVVSCLRQYGRWHPLLPLRLIACAVIVLLLANPVTRRTVPSVVMPSMALVVDASASMGEGDGSGGRMRLEEALEAASMMERTLETSYRVQSYTLRDDLSTGLLDAPSGNTSFEPLARLAGMVPRPEAVVLVSDGADWSGSRPEADLGGAGIPVHALGVGTRKTATNLSVRIEAPGPTVAPGQDVALSCVVASSGDLDGVSTELVLEEIGESGAPRQLLRRRLVLGDDMRVGTTVNVGETLGARLWRARAMVLPGEETDADNEALLSLQVADRSLRVLVVEGKPWWDTTMAVRAFRRDRQLDVTTWFHLGPRTYRAGTDLGTRIDAALLAKLDVLALGTGIDELLDATAQEAVTGWVRDGGSLLLLAPDPMLTGPLQAIAPVTWGETTADAPAELDREPGPRANRGPTVRVRSAASLAPHTIVLRGEPEAPLLALRRSGKGRVVAMNMEGLWRASMVGSGRDGDGGDAARLWRQLLREATRPVGGKLRADRLRYRVGDRATVWVGGADGASVTEVGHLLPSGASERLAGHGGRVRVLLGEPGVHRFSVADEAMIVVVERHDRELLLRARDDARLTRLAEATGGSHRDVSEAADLAEELSTRRGLEEPRVESTPLVTHRGWFWSVAGALGLEWLLRRRRFGLT